MNIRVEIAKNSSGLYTEKLQSAIDAVHNAGGGKVTVESGTYLTGTLWLKSNVELHLKHGAMLLGSPDIKNYNELDAYSQNYSCEAEGWQGNHLIIAHECENVAITGLGTINGNGFEFMSEMSVNNDEYRVLNYPWRYGTAREKVPGIWRPGQMVCFIECKNVNILNVTFSHSPCWTVFLHGCENVNINGVRIYNPHYWLNTDGIDIDCCRFVTVSNCNIQTGDDAITFRGVSKYLKNKEKVCEFVTVTNCVLSASASAFRIGVGTAAIRNITVSNIAISRAGIGINFFPEWANTSHTPLDYISFSNITAAETGRLIELNISNNTPCRHIALNGISGNACSAVRMVSKNSGAVSDITLNSISATAIDDTSAYTTDDTPEAPDGRFFHCAGIENLNILNCRIAVENSIAAKLLKTVDIENNTNAAVQNCSFNK